jgi:prevent-host-death family protein
MRTASAEEVGAEFHAYLRATAKGPVVVTRNAKPVAVLMSLDDPDELERITMSHSKKLQRIVRASQRQIDQGKGLSSQQFWREVEEMRKKKKA